MQSTITTTHHEPPHLPCPTWCDLNARTPVDVAARYAEGAGQVEYDHLYDSGDETADTRGHETIIADNERWRVGIFAAERYTPTEHAIDAPRLDVACDGLLSAEQARSFAAALVAAADQLDRINAERAA